MYLDNCLNYLLLSLLNELNELEDDELKVYNIFLVVPPRQLARRSTINDT